MIVGVYQNIVIIIIYIHEYTMGSLYKPLTLLLHGAGIDTKICPKITQFCRFLYTSTMEHMGHLHTFTSFTVFRGTKIDFTIPKCEEHVESRATEKLRVNLGESQGCESSLNLDGLDG